MTTPTTEISVVLNAADLVRVYAALDAGVEPDELIELLAAEEGKAPIDPELLAKAKEFGAAKKPTVMVTEFPDGIVIGWDHCSILNSGCGKPVSKCACKGGPKEARVFTEWRTGAKAMPDYGTPSPEAPEAGPAANATTPVAAPTTPANSVPCREGKHFAPIGEASKNDDGTYTCFTCQEAGVQVSRD